MHCDALLSPVEVAEKNLGGVNFPNLSLLPTENIHIIFHPIPLGAELSLPSHPIPTNSMRGTNDL